MTRLSDEAARAMGKSFDWPRTYGRGLVATFQDYQRAVNRNARSLLDQLTTEPRERTRPMNINITIRAIANGFLVEADNGPCYDTIERGSPGAKFFPDFVAVTDALPQMAYDARERAELAEARMKAEVAKKQREYRTGGSILGGDFTNSGHGFEPKGVKGFTIGEGLGWGDDEKAEDARAYSDTAKETINNPGKLPEEQAVEDMGNRAGPLDPDAD